MKEKGTHRYDDIIHLPRHVSPTRPRMSRLERAAQFSPFAALTGYEEAVREEARLTEERIELDDTEIADLDTKLRFLRDHPGARASVVFFRPDKRKAGGAYVTAAGGIKKIDPIERTVTMQAGETIPIDSIVEITIL